MANESLTVSKNNARLELIGKTWANELEDSGEGWDIDDWDDWGTPDLPDDMPDVDLPDLDNFDFNYSDYVDDMSDLSYLPTSIKVTGLPYPKNLKYTDGEKISIVGISCRAYKDDGSYYSDYVHTDKFGRIKMSELQFSPRVAGFLTMDDLVLRSDRFSSTVSNRHFTATAEEFASIFINENDYYWMRVTFISRKKGVCGTFNNAPAVADKLVYANGSERLYMSQQYDYSHACGEHLIPYYDTYEPLTAEAIQDELGRVVISWPRPVDGLVLQDSYQITVTADDSVDAISGAG